MKQVLKNYKYNIQIGVQDAVSDGVWNDVWIAVWVSVWNDVYDAVRSDIWDDVHDDVKEFRRKLRKYKRRNNMKTNWEFKHIIGAGMWIGIGVMNIFYAILPPANIVQAFIGIVCSVIGVFGWKMLKCEFLNKNIKDQ